MPEGIEFVRADGKLFRALVKQWDGIFDESLKQHYAPWLEYGRQIATEDPPHRRYGIYVLQSTKGKSKVYEAFCHVNHKLPRTSASEVRVVWNTVSPSYETKFTDEKLARLTAGFIFGAIRLSETEMPARVVKLYLNNGVDKQYAAGLAAGLNKTLPDYSLEIKGNWLHIERDN